MADGEFEETDEEFQVEFEADGDWTNESDFDTIMGAEFAEPVARPPLPVLAQSKFYGAEALIQVVDFLHIQDQMVAELKESFPEYGELQEGNAVSYGMKHYDLKGDVFAAVEYANWLGELVTALGAAISNYLADHQLAPHIHFWVRLPGLGFMPCAIGKGVGQEGTDFLLALPARMIERMQEERNGQ